MRTFGRLAALAVLAVALSFAAGVRAQEGPGAEPASNPAFAGHWVGAKLRCQKDEGKLVRCGTPSSFEITFSEDGTGSTSDESFPKSFTWTWSGAGEVAVLPAAGGEPLKLFAVERDEDALTFQAYFFLPTADPNAPVEARYIHIIFDVNRVE